MKKFTVETAFGAYTLTEVLGEGGAGRVYGGTDVEGNPIAVKVLSIDSATTDKRRRFKNEIAFLLRTKHPNIVSVIDHGMLEQKSAKCPFYVMARYRENLRQRMEAGLSPNEALRLFHGALDGVEAAHLKGSVHRDLKPENVLIDFLGSPAIADFGVASFTDDLVATLVETRPSQRLANFMYAAPEQRVPGNAISLTADIYALGLMLNELFTGEVAHGTDYRRIGGVNKDHAYLDDVVAQMMRQDPRNRFASIAGVKGAIAHQRSEFLTLQKISKIDGTVIPEGEIDEPLAHTPPKLVDADWENETLTLTLDRPVSIGWVSAFTNMGNYRSIPGAGPEMFRFLKDKASVNVHASNAQRVIDHFKEWLPRATQVYKYTLEQQLQQDKRRREDELKRQRALEEERLRVLGNLRI